jgi:hypothetical protein
LGFCGEGDGDGESLAHTLAVVAGGAFSVAEG